jgi:NAD(P)H-hydrate epimerase
VETTWLLLPEQLGVISPKAVDAVKRHLDGYAALLVGPGLTQEPEAVQFVHRLLGVGDERRRVTGFVPGSQPAPADAAQVPREPSSPGKQVDADGPAMGFLSRRSAPEATPGVSLSEVPLVLDADALNALAQVDTWPRHAPPNSILTPHPGEMARLCGCTTREVQADRIAMARSMASRWSQVVLLKGAYSVVAAPDGRTVVLPFANPALATAGSGDVLAGAIVGLLSQGLAPFEAAVLGGYLHGLAGELARNELGKAGTLAGDLLARLPLAIRQLESV